ncbi:MAG: transcription elongation factor GreA [Candidatus Falkowbacteria bacterium]
MTSQIISPEGYAKLQEELETLSTVRRREIAERIEAAKELGDLSENAEYADAKEAQAFNEGRVGELTNLLKNLTVVENDRSDIIGMGTKVTAEINGNIKEYTIVSFNEADPMAGKISNESPIGISLLGHKKGDLVKVKTPKGESEYKIIDVK